MTLPQFCLSYIESRLVWAGFKPPLPPRNGRFSLARVLVMTFGQTVVGAAIGWAVAALLGFLFHRTGPFVLFNGPFSWLVWLLAALSACQGIISYGFTALCWNQRAAQLLTDPTLDVKLKPTRYPVFRWLLGLVYFVIFALIAPVALLWTVENVRGEMLWRMERNKLIALGERLTFRDILGPTIPPEQNAAAAPIFAPFFNYKIEPYKIEPTQTETFHAVWLDTNGLQRFDDRLTIPGKIWPQREKSAAGEPHTPAGNLSAWAESYRHYLANPPKDAPSWTATLKLPSDTNNPARVVLAGLSVGDQELAEICDATLRPRSQFPIHYDENFSALLRHLAPFKSVSQRLDLRCAALLEVGETEAAFHDAQCALRVPELLREEPFLISQLVRLAQGSIATRTVWQGLAEHRWTDAQLAAFQNAFSRINYLPGLELAFEGERACGIQTMDGWISKGGMISQTVGPDENGSSMQFPTRFLSRGLLRQNEIALARYHQQMIASVRSAISNAPESGLAAVAKNASDVTDRTGRDLRPFSPYKVMAAMLAPALGKAVQKAARAQTTARMATVACALERYRIAHGTFPETLESLAPQFIAQMPLDPMVNQPFHYQRTEDGWFQLYSVGLNGKDDGGVLLSDDKKDKEDKDWPWPVPTRPQKRNLF